MIRGPAPGGKTNRDYVSKVREVYGGALPDWVEELAVEATNTSAVSAAKKIGYSAGLISHVFSNRYKGDLVAVEQKVRGALMGMTVTCPILGEIGRDLCLDNQKKPFSATSSIRSKLYRACRSGCPHSRLKEG